MTDDKTIIPLKGIRGIIARSLSNAWQAPRVAEGIDVDMSASLKQIKTETQASGIKLSVTHAIMKAVVKTLIEYPEINGIVSDQGIEHWANVNLGIAVNTEVGVVVPVLMSSQEKSMIEMAAKVKSLADGARNGKLAPSAYQKGTFTISSLGTTGIDWFTPVLNPPQIAILGIGSIKERAVVDSGKIVVRPMMTITLVFDHRALDGYPAGKFLSALAQRLSCADY